MRTPGRKGDIRRVYEISTHNPEELVHINLVEILDGNGYIAKLDLMNTICSRGGKKFCDKPSTFDDPLHPGFVVLLEGFYNGDDVSCAFLLDKRNEYNSAYCFECHQGGYLDGKNWTYVPGGNLGIVGAQPALFDVKYSKSSVKKIAKAKAYLGNSVGREVILSALWHLKFGTQPEQRVAFQAICRNLCEPLRFEEIAARVKEAFDLGQVLKLGTLMDLIKHYGALCRIYRNKFLMNLTEGQVNDSLAKYSDLNLQTFKDLHQALRIVLVEKEAERGERRMEAVRQDQRVLKYHNLVLYDCVEKKTPCWLNSKGWSKVDLERARMFELNRLILSGGDEGNWRILFECMHEKDPRYVKLKLKNSDLSLMNKDLSKAIDDKGFVYIFQKDFMFCDPVDGLKGKRRKRIRKRIGALNIFKKFKFI